MDLDFFGSSSSSNESFFDKFVCPVHRLSDLVRAKRRTRNGKVFSISASGFDSVISFVISSIERAISNYYTMLC